MEQRNVAIQRALLVASNNLQAPSAIYEAYLNPFDVRKSLLRAFRCWHFGPRRVQPQLESGVESSGCTHAVGFW